MSAREWFHNGPSRCQRLESTTKCLRVCIKDLEKTLASSARPTATHIYGCDPLCLRIEATKGLLSNVEKATKEENQAKQLMSL